MQDWHVFQSSLNIIKIVLDVDIDKIEREVVTQTLNSIISVNLFIGKKPLKEKQKLEQAIQNMFEQSSSYLSSSNIIGTMFLLKNNVGDCSIRANDLFSLLFIDYRV